MPAPAWTRARRATAVGIAVAMMVAGGVGTILILEQKAGNSPAIVKDGPTMFEAISLVNGSVQNVTGGPWSLFSVYGVAAQLPFSPNVIGYPLDNHTVNSCGALFNGVTLWNGSIPVFTGTFNSGTAPFWQFGYFSGTTNQVIVATDLLGVAHVYPPQPRPGPCYPWNDVPGPMPWAEALTHVTEDSSVAAPAAWTAAASGWPNVSEPFAQIITMGPNLFDGWGYVTGGYLFIFERCGLANVTGVQPQVSVAVNWSSTQAVGSGPGGGNCAAMHSYQGKPGLDYRLLFASPTVLNLSPTKQVSIPFQLAFAYATNGSLIGFYDGWGLANWMTSWNLTHPSLSHLSVAGPGCRSWVPSVTDCAANATGWYAVLLSSSGSWIDSYGVRPDGTLGWSQSVTAIVSNQQIVIVVPISWNVTGDSLGAASTVPSCVVTGSVTF